MAFFLFVNNHNTTKIALTINITGKNNPKNENNQNFDGSINGDK